MWAAGLINVKEALTFVRGATKRMGRTCSTKSDQGYTQRSLNTNFHDQHPHANYVPSELPAVDIPPPGASYMPDPVEHQDEVN